MIERKEQSVRLWVWVWVDSRLEDGGMCCPADVHSQWGPEAQTGPPAPPVAEAPPGPELQRAQTGCRFRMLCWREMTRPHLGGREYRPISSQHCGTIHFQNLSPFKYKGTHLPSRFSNGPGAVSCFSWHTYHCKPCPNILFPSQLPLF